MRKRYPRIPIKKPEVPGCPFRAGDYVRKNTGISTFKFSDVMLVTSVCDIPDIHDPNEGYGKDVKNLPYWFYGTDVHGEEYVGENTRKEHRGAIWVGYVKLDPFLGKAKRAVMEDGENFHS